MHADPYLAVLQIPLNGVDLCEPLGGTVTGADVCRMFNTAVHEFRAEARGSLIYKIIYSRF
jgi:hypothetical protein